MMKNIFISTVNFQKTKDLTDDLLGPALGVEMAAVIGPAGRGKTFAIERIYTQNKNTVYVLYQESWSHIELMREITFQLTGDRPRLRQKCFDIIQDENREKRRLIMVDDADRMDSKCLNVLRNIHDILKIPVVVVGEPPLERKILREKRLKSRTRNMLFYAPVGHADVIVFFKQMMGASLSQDQAARLLKYCEGDFRPLLTGAVKAEKIMVASGIGAVTDRIVDEICRNGKR